MQNKPDKQKCYQIVISILSVMAILSIFLPCISIGFWGYKVQFSPINLFQMDTLESLLEYADVSTAVFTVMRVIVIVMAFCDMLAIVMAWKGKRWMNWLIMLIGVLEAGIGVFMIYCALAAPSMFGTKFSVQIGAVLRLMAGIGLAVGSVLLYKAWNMTGMKAPQSASIREGRLLGVVGFYEDADIPVGETPIMLGRDQNFCNIVLKEPDISRKHCSIVYDAVRELYIVRDFSSNGTFLADGTPLKKDVANELHSGDQIRVGKEQVFMLK